MNSEKIITEQRNGYLSLKLSEKFVFAPLGVFITGVSVIFLTRYIFYIYHPSYFDGRIPSISKSAAFAPGSYVFCLGIIIVCTCIFITVTYIKEIYHERISRLTLSVAESRHMEKLCNTGCYIAYSAAIFLLLLSIVSLEVHDPVHITLSILFFATQNVAFVYDFVCTQKINRYIRQHSASTDVLPGKGRAILFIAITCLSLLYLFMFLTKDSTIYNDNYFAHQIYTTTEYTWATLAFLYPALYYPEVKKHIEQQHTEAGPPGNPDHR